jgi:hypothetical protein
MKAYAVCNDSIGTYSIRPSRWLALRDLEDDVKQVGQPLVVEEREISDTAVTFQLTRSEVREAAIEAESVEEFIEMLGLNELTADFVHDVVDNGEEGTSLWSRLEADRINGGIPLWH